MFRPYIIIMNYAKLHNMFLSMFILLVLCSYRIGSGLVPGWFCVGYDSTGMVLSRNYDNFVWWLSGSGCVLCFLLGF